MDLANEMKSVICEFPCDQEYVDVYQILNSILKAYVHQHTVPSKSQPFCAS